MFEEGGPVRPQNQSSIDIRNLLRVVDVDSLRSLPPGDPAIATALQPIFENIVYGHLNETSLSLLSDGAISNLVSTLQLSCMHMMHAQNSLQKLVDSANFAAKEARDSQAQAEMKLASLQHEVKARRRLQRETDTLLSTMTGTSSYSKPSALPTSSLSSIATSTGGTVYRCSHCPKAFLTTDFLDSHISRRHGRAFNIATVVSRTSDYVNEETASLKAEISALRSDLARSHASSETLMSERSNALFHTHSSNSDAAALSVTASAMRNDVNALRLALEQQRIASEESLAERDSRISELSAENAAIMGGLRSQLQDLEVSLLSQLGGAQSSAAVSGGSPKRRSMKSSTLKAPPSASAENAADISKSDSARRFRHKVVILSPRTRSLVLCEDGFAKENSSDIDNALVDKESNESTLHPRQSNKLTTQLFLSPLSSKSAPSQVITISKDSQSDPSIVVLDSSSLQSINEPILAASDSPKHFSESTNGPATENADDHIATTVSSVPVETEAISSLAAQSHEQVGSIVTLPALNHSKSDEPVAKAVSWGNQSTPTAESEPALQALSSSSPSRTEIIEDKSVATDAISTSPVIEESKNEDSKVVHEASSSMNSVSLQSPESVYDNRPPVSMNLDRTISEEKTTSTPKVVDVLPVQGTADESPSTVQKDASTISVNPSAPACSTSQQTSDELSCAHRDSDLEEGEVDDSVNNDKDIEVKSESVEELSQLSLLKPIPVLVTSSSIAVRDGDSRRADVRRAIEVSMRTVFGSLLLPSSTHPLLNFPKRDANAVAPRQRSASAAPLVIPAPGTEIKRDFSNITAPSLDESFQTAASTHPRSVAVIDAADAVLLKVQEEQQEECTRSAIINEPDRLEEASSASTHLSEHLVPPSIASPATIDVSIPKDYEPVLPAMDENPTHSTIQLTDQTTAQGGTEESNTEFSHNLTSEGDQSVPIMINNSAEVIDQSIAQQIESGLDIVEEELLAEELEKVKESAAEANKNDANDKSYDYDDDDDIESSYAKIVSQERKKGLAHDDETDIEIEDL